MTQSLPIVASTIILALDLAELLLFRELTAVGRQSSRLRVAVQVEERLPAGRRFGWGNQHGDPRRENSGEEKWV